MGWRGSEKNNLKRMEERNSLILCSIHLTIINLQEMNVAFGWRPAGKRLIITLGKIPVDHSKCPRKPMFVYFHQHSTVKCLTFKMYAR